MGCINSVLRAVEDNTQTTTLAKATVKKTTKIGHRHHHHEKKNGGNRGDGLFHRGRRMAANNGSSRSIQSYESYKSYATTSSKASSRRGGRFLPMCRVLWSEETDCNSMSDAYIPGQENFDREAENWKTWSQFRIT